MLDIVEVLWWDPFVSAWITGLCSGELPYSLYDQFVVASPSDSLFSVSVNLVYKLKL